MKKLTILILFLCTLSCTGKTAIGYNDTIIKPQLIVVDKMDSILTDSTITYERVKFFRNEMIENAKKGLEATKKLTDFNGNTSFKNAGISYFSFVTNYFEKTENIDSILFKYTSTERMNMMDDVQYENAQREFNEYIKLEQALLEEQQKFAKEFNMPFTH